jgi:glycosyltransferase involved in cell wall biosynthesis
MHVCVLSDRYPPHHGGGAGIIAANLAEGYAASGHDVTVVTGVEDEANAGRRVRNGVAIEAVAVPTFGPLRAYYSVYHPVAVRKVAPVFERHEFDAVHAHNLHQFLSYHALKLADRHASRVVLTFHDAMSVEYGKLVPDEPPADEASADEPLAADDRATSSAYRVSPWDQFKKRKVFYFPLRNRLNRAYLNGYVDVGVSVSEALRRALVANGVESTRVVHNGIDVKPYDAADGATFRNEVGLGDERIVLYSGRVSYYKGGEHLARAFARVAEACDEDVRLVVTGTNTEFVGRMRDLAGSHGDEIVATGWLDEETLRSAYDAATVVASPSIYLDPFPTVNLEAMAAGTPVVTTCYGGAKELVVDGETGVVVDPRDVSALADALSGFVSNPDRCRQFGANGRHRVEAEFALDAQVETYLDLLAGDRRRASPVSSRGTRD